MHLRTTRARHALPLLAAAGLLAACSHPKPLADESTGQWDAAVEKHVHDAARAARLKDLGHELIALGRTMRGQEAELQERAFALWSTYDATAGQARDQAESWAKRRRDDYARYRDLVFAMRREATAEEWKALVR